MKDTLSVLTIIFCIGGFLPYTISILREKSKPAKATWIIWAWLDGVTFGGMVMEGTENPQIISSTAGASVVAILALRYGSSGWTITDKICLFAGLLGSALLIVSDPLSGMLVGLAGILIGSIPTIISAWKNPKDEDKLAWILFSISGLLAIVSIPKWTWEDATQPIVFFAIEGGITSLIFLRPLWLPTQNPQR